MKRTKIKKSMFIFFVVLVLIFPLSSAHTDVEWQLNNVNAEMNNHLGIPLVFLKSEPFNITKEKIFDRMIQRAMKIARLSALSAAVVVNNETIWAKGFGLYDRENGKEATNETIYLMASISKTVTSTAVMQLCERGYFGLDDDVNNFLPFGLRNPNYPDVPITFRMLLSHTSSIAPEESDSPINYYIRVIPANETVEGYPYPFLKEYLVPGGLYYRSNLWLDIRPGKKMAYSNIAFGVLGYLVEIISNKSFEEYCQENIFEPLDMKDSSFLISNINVSKLAIPYNIEKRKYVPIMHFTFMDYPAGGLRTSVLDLSHFLIAHMNGGVYNGTRILNESTVEEMHTIQCNNTDHNFKYGLGWQIWGKPGNKNQLIFHGGGSWGVTTVMDFSPYDKIGIIFFTNINQHGSKIQDFREKISISFITALLFGKGFMS